MAAGNRDGRLGVWLIGAHGAIATSVVHGLAGLVQGLLEPVGIATARGPLARLPLRPFPALVLGGHEVRRGSLAAAAEELVRHRVLSPALVAAAAAEVAALAARVRPGLPDAPAADDPALLPAAVALAQAPGAEQSARLAADLEAFRAAHGLERVVVVNLASTEAWRDEDPAWASRSAFEDALHRPGALPASCVYAHAALAAGFPFVNFTPNRAASIPALRELARARGVPHCGDDGKTGETLLKAALAPMFAARALKVLTWQGYNMLGNRDGEVLADPVRREAKIRHKDAVVRAILGDDDVHTAVQIDFVPSLHDWKTAWDFIHFEGFLGAKMSLQLTWAGSDSALAAPLVLDLVRLADFAAARGEAGEMAHTACYFKAPLAGGSHDFHAQFRALLDYAERHLAPR
ncbi:MAG: inositol-3-phosphate synthase [Planctomycetota bacterium]